MPKSEIVHPVKSRKAGISSGAKLFNRVKIVVYVPEAHADAVRKAMGKAGAGKLENYSFCSFSAKGVGRFKPEKGSHPTIGKVGNIEQVVEERIETICERNKLRKVISAIQKVHPYEEVAIDIYPLAENF